MSVSIKTVEFERRAAHLSELENGPPYTINGVALGEDDVTVGQSGIKKLWPADELKKAADTLEGRNLVVDHDNSSSGVVGQVTKAGYKEGVGVLYEAELFEDDLAEKIDKGLLEVSIRGIHKDVEEMDENDDGAKIVGDIEFDNLSIVPSGAAPSNTLEMGEAEELSASTIRSYTDELQEDEEDEEDAEIEPGMWVQWDGGRGVTISQVEDGEIEVDIYEESDGKWRSTGETSTVSVNELSEWDVDEEEDIGAAEDDEEESDEEEAAQDIPDKFFYDSEEDAMEFIEGEEGLTGVHEMDGQYVPGDTHEEFLEWWDNQSSQSGHEEEEDEEEMEEELQETEVHEPEYSSTVDQDWNKPSLEDFGDDPDLSDVADHFLVSMTGFPPENYGDLKLPVVEPDGALNINALQAVKSRLSQTEGVSAEDKDRIESIVNRLASEEFDKDWEEARAEGEEGVVGEDVSKDDIKEQSPERYPEGAEEEAAERPRTIDDTGDEQNVADSGPVDIALQLINKYLRIEGKHERDSVDNMIGWLFGSTDLPTETIDDFRVAANAFLGEQGGADSFDAVTVEQFRDWLLTRGSPAQQENESVETPPIASPVHVLTGDDLWRSSKSRESELDSINPTKVTTNMTEDIEEKLAELNEPVAVEESDLEELQQKADQFEEMNSNLEELRERTEILDDVDREQVEELAEGEAPVVVESTRYEELEAEAEQVKGIYAEALAEAYDVFDAEELTDKFSIEELREKYSENIGEPEEELAAEPRSGDPSEEELEEQAEEEASEEEEELSEDVAQKQEELRSKILSNTRR